MIYSYIQINIPKKIFAFMSIITQGLEINNTSNWKEEWMSQCSRYTSPSQILIAIVKSHTNMLHSCANLMKECTTFNNDVITFNPSNVSTNKSSIWQRLLWVHLMPCS